MIKDEQIQEFFELCEDSSFPHREELLNGIQSEEFTLISHSDTELPGKHFHDIYSVRVKILARYKSSHAKRIRKEVLLFLEKLESLPDERIKGWSFSTDEVSSFMVFEGVNSRKILGCILATDKIRVSEDKWQKLWNEE